MISDSKFSLKDKLSSFILSTKKGAIGLLNPFYKKNLLYIE